LNKKIIEKFIFVFISLFPRPWL